MEATLRVLNQMETEGIIGRYAIGGAVAATVYVEPMQTFDLDIFLEIPVSTSGLLSISPIYVYLMGKGYQPEGEAVRIEGWPVQFLPLIQFFEEKVIEQDKFAMIVERHNLSEKWKQFKARFLDEKA